MLVIYREHLVWHMGEMGECETSNRNKDLCGLETRECEAEACTARGAQRECAAGARLSSAFSSAHLSSAARLRDLECALKVIGSRDEIRSPQ